MNTKPFPPSRGIDAPALRAGVVPADELVDEARYARQRVVELDAQIAREETPFSVNETPDILEQN